MKFIPHDYQQYASDYIENNPIAAIFLDIKGASRSIVKCPLQILRSNTFLSLHPPGF